MPTKPTTFRLNPRDWDDLDGDGYGDSMLGVNYDEFKFDPTQQTDRDGDGYGDNIGGTRGDACPDTFGTSTVDRTAVWIRTVMDGRTPGTGSLTTRCDGRTRMATTSRILTHVPLRPHAMERYRRGRLWRQSVRFQCGQIPARPHPVVRH